MSVKKVVKTLGIFVCIYLICCLILVIIQGVLMTVFNAVFSFIADDAWRMYYSSIAVRFLVLIVLFWVIYFTTKYKLIFDKLELARAYDGVVPTARELLIARMKDPQNITELIAFFAAVLLMFGSMIRSSPVSYIITVILSTAFYYAIDVLIDYIVCKRQLSARMRI